MSDSSSRDERVTTSERTAGVVVWFDDSKGFGFIKPANGGPDVFVHHKDIRVADRATFRTLSENQTVEFTPAIGRNKKPCATDVTPRDQRVTR